MTLNAFPSPQIACGIDIITLAQMTQILNGDTHDTESFLQRFYTPAEQAYCETDIERIAGRWAAKEAISKALGTGMHGIDWRDIEVLPDALGQPQVHFYGDALNRATFLQLTQWAVSISHSTTDATAIAVALRR